MADIPNRKYFKLITYEESAPSYPQTSEEPESPLNPPGTGNPPEPIIPGFGLSDDSGTWKLTDIDLGDLQAINIGNLAQRIFGFLLPPFDGGGESFGIFGFDKGNGSNKPKIYLDFSNFVTGNGVGFELAKTVGSDEYEVKFYKDTAGVRQEFGLSTDGRIYVLDNLNQRGMGDAADYSATKEDNDYATKKMALPAGGTTGQVPKKLSNTSYDVAWGDEAGGGADSNAVHYNATDGKTGSERSQARANIGSTSMEPQIVTDTGTINDLNATSNTLVFSGAGDKTLTGISAGEHGEEIVIIVINGTLTIAGESGLSIAANRFQTQFNGFKIEQYGSIRFKRNTALSSSPRWWIVGDKIYVSINGGVRKFNTLYLKSTAGESMTIWENVAGTQVGKFDIGGLTLNSGLNVTSNGIWFRASTAGATIASFRTSTGTDVLEVRSDRLNAVNFTIDHARSSSSIKSIRRDEQRLYYLVSVTTAGSIADQALTDGIFNYRFTAATDISGFGNGEIGRTIDIDNATGSTLTLLHENAGSIAANRIKLIGAADLVIPIDGKVTLKYCTGSRWELVSKNF